ncbi:MAG: hypothetical protein SPH83_11475, partial [Treponema sp.]|nr:hypothetical protein [Spirochaetales bacterium]MDY6191100.1 hypothetical protein [Treponema sp.]
CARRFLGYRNYYNAALAAAPKKVFLPCVSLPRANFYENIFYNAFALLRQPLQSLPGLKPKNSKLNLIVLVNTLLIFYIKKTEIYKYKILHLI